MHYYNDNDARACAWLRQLIADRLIPEGKVDERPIQEVRASDLRGFTQHHFFAGIGGWARALQLAGFPADRPVWTASCPCQPFSTAGRQKGVEDERHLWPVLATLVRECRPQLVVGEQVGGDAGYRWLDGVRADLESLDYACGAADLPACCQGAPHIRQRIFWVSVANGQRLRAHGSESTHTEAREDQGAGHQRQWLRPDAAAGDSAVAGWLPEPTLHGQGHGCEQGRSPGSGRSDAGGCSGDFWDRFTVVPCRDGRSRRAPAEPVFLVVSDGLSSCLGTVWGAGIDAIKEKAVMYATQAKTGPGEALSTLWRAAYAKAIRHHSGVHEQFSAEAILLLALLQAAWSLGPELRGTTSYFEEASQACVRVLRSDSTRFASAARSSSERGLEGSSTGKPEGTVHSLSSATAQQEATGAVPSLRSAGTEAWYVPEALSAVEEVWRSTLEQTKGCGDYARICNYARAVMAANSFPLAARIPGRVGLLRGAGNAIVPQVAAAFVRAYLQVERAGR